jgi:hypothetical protein
MKSNQMMKTALPFFLFINSLHSGDVTSLSFQDISNKYFKKSNSKISNPSFVLRRAAIQFARQIRAINQFLNPVTANSGNNEVFCSSLKLENLITSAANAALCEQILIPNSSCNRSNCAGQIESNFRILAV